MRNPTVYTASKTRHANIWRKLRDNGILNIIATWINVDENDRNFDWEKLWIDCASESAAADITLVYLEDGDTLRGAYVEMGIAIASGRTVFLVNPHGENVTDARHHPLVSEFRYLTDAIAAIRRMGNRSDTPQEVAQSASQ